MAHLTPEPGYIHLILKEPTAGQLNVSPFYLRIPIIDLRSLTLSPLKFLRYLGWCVMGGEGTVANSPTGTQLPEINHADVVDRTVYYFTVSGAQCAFTVYLVAAKSHALPQTILIQLQSTWQLRGSVYHHTQTLLTGQVYAS